MPKNTSVTLGEHFEGFIADQIKDGRFASTSEVVRTALRLLEERELKVTALRQALKEGEESAMAEYSLEGLIDELDQEHQC